jgi:hypothetical protein
VAVWFLTLCFINRNPILRTGAEDVLMVGLFLLMFAPSGKALSLDRLREKRRKGEAVSEPPMTPAWPVRLIQFQVCMIYFTTGLAKLVRNFSGEVDPFTDGWWEEFFSGTWWDGTSLHYVLNNITLTRWSYAQLPVPFWLTAPATYLSVCWEVLFPFLVMSRWTRKWALWFGVLFHLGIFLTIEIGWFSFYTLSLYGVWIPGRFWDRVFGRPERPG